MTVLWSSYDFSKIWPLVFRCLMCLVLSHRCSEGWPHYSARTIKIKLWNETEATQRHFRSIWFCTFKHKTIKNDKTAVKRFRSFISVSFQLCEHYYGWSCDIQLPHRTLHRHYCVYRVLDFMWRCTRNISLWKVYTFFLFCFKFQYPVLNTSWNLLFSFYVT